METANDEISLDALRNAVLAALEEAGQKCWRTTWKKAEWRCAGGEVTVKVGMSQVLIDIALGAEPKRIIQASLSKAAQRPLKFKMISGGAATVNKTNGSCAAPDEWRWRARPCSERSGRAAHAGKIRRRDSHRDRPERSRMRGRKGTRTEN